MTVSVLLQTWGRGADCDGHMLHITRRGWAYGHSEQARLSSRRVTLDLLYKWRETRVYIVEWATAWSLLDRSCREEDRCFILDVYEGVPDCRTVFHSPPTDPENHNGPLMHLLNAFVTIVVVSAAGEPVSPVR